MKKYRHTHRSVILFLLLTPLTIFIYPIVVFHHIGKETNRMYEGVEGYKKSMPFLGAFFLGFITLGIVPLVWTCKVASKIGRKGYALGIRKPHTSAVSMVWLTFIFGWLIITFLIGFTKFLHTVNAVERKLNALMEEKAEEEAKAEILPEPAPEELPAPAEEPVVEEKKEEEPKPEEAEAPKEEPAAEPVKEIPEEYRPDPTPTVRKWRVRLSNSDEFKLFDSQEEALAYAKGLAAKNRAVVRLKK